MTNTFHDFGSFKILDNFVLKTPKDTLGWVNMEITFELIPIKCFGIGKRWRYELHCGIRTQMHPTDMLDVRIGIETLNVFKDGKPFQHRRSTEGKFGEIKFPKKMKTFPEDWNREMPKLIEKLFIRGVLE